MAKKKPGAWVLAADMGYGHQRAAWALSHLSPNKKIFNASSYPGIPPSDKRIWQATRHLYEAVSRFKRIPVLGDMVFGIFDKFQEIEEFYPKTQGIEHPTLQLQQVYGLIKNRSWGKALIEKLNKKPLPLVSSFSIIAFMAEHWGYKGKICLVITDTDVSRAWAPLKPRNTAIYFFVSTLKARDRLMRYGVPEAQIVETGFPLPQGLVKNTKQDLYRRLQVLDPQRAYFSRYQDVVKRYLGAVPPKPKRQVPLTLTFAVGGAGVQRETGGEILGSLGHFLRQDKVKLNLVAGTRKDVAGYFRKKIQEQNLRGTGVQVIVEKSIPAYFEKFQKVLRQTDILWTKPSELVFYAALGIPLILSSPIGSQEVHNKKWLLSIGAGIDQMNPKFVHQWLPDLMKEGTLAEAAMQGFVEMERNGTQNISNLLSSL